MKKYTFEGFHTNQEEQTLQLEGQLEKFTF